MGSLEKLFRPRSVAVIGASGTPGKIGYVIVDNLRTSGYQGKVYPINPKQKQILGFPAAPKITDIGEEIDLAVISVPAELVPAVCEDCGKAGVKFLVVITAGFKEIGKEGLEREKKLMEIARSYGMRVMGPNCVGMMDTATPINASFAHAFPLKGNIAFISQSGAMLVGILDWSLEVGLGFSRFISLGNKADLNEVDFIQECAEDPETKVIIMYLEDVVEGRRFLEVAREVSREKPVIVYKSGTTQAGARAASSHTGALAGSDVAYETAFNQSGVIRARNLDELFDLAIAFTKQPVPRGDRVAVVTMAGGLGIITTDNIDRRGLTMARFTDETITALRRELPRESNIYNPVDVLGDASPERMKTALDYVLKDDNVDAVIPVVCPTGVTDVSGMADAILEVAGKYPDKPVFACLTGGVQVADQAKKLALGGVPAYTFPEPAVQVIERMVRYGRMKQARKKERLSFPDVSKIEVKAVLYDVLRDRRHALLPSEAAKVAAAYGISTCPIELADTPEAAAEIAENLGYPVVLKVASPEIVHKTDVGGVLIGLNNSEEVRKGFAEILNNVHGFFPDAPVYGVEVQKMMPRGIEVIIGMTRDIQFGPLIAFGMGGIYVNLLKDVSFRLAQGLTQEEIESMIKETKTYALLRGYRGDKPADIGALVEAIARLSQLVLDFPEIAEVDINPVFAYEQGISALDVKITIS